MLEKALHLDCWAQILKRKEPSDDSEGMTTSDLVMPELPFKPSDLDPVLSSSSVDAHQQIHKGYVDRSRELVRGTSYADMTLKEAVEEAAKKDKDSELFRNLSQAWNHAFYWMSISPPGQGTAPKSALLEAVNKKYGSIDKCRDTIIEEASKMFGSGYVWVVQDKEELSVVLTKDAATPLAEGLKPLLCLDLWEHAYYLDYEGDRMSYIDSGVKELLNWGFADRNWEGGDEW